MGRVIEYDLADHIPFPVDQVVVDFQQVGRSKEEPGLLDVLVAAAPRELIREYLKVAEELGLSVASLTIDALELDELTRMLEAEPRGLAVSLDMGPRATTINVSEGDRLRLTRSVTVGGNQLLRAIQDDLGVSREEAERALESEGMDLLERGQAAERVTAWLANLIGEIRRSALSFGPGVVSRIVLTGPFSGMQGLPGRLGAEFDTQSIRLSAKDLFPGSEMLGPDAGTADRCLVAIAGATRTLGRGTWTVSLLPREVRQARRERRLRAAGVLAGLGVVAGMVVVYLMLAGNIQRERIEVESLRKKSEAAAVREKEADAVLTERANLKTEADSLEMVRLRRYAALELLRTIALYSPKEIVLTSFTLRPDQPLQIRGTAPSSSMVADLQHSLEQSPLVTNASLTRADRIAARGQIRQELDFTMEARLWDEKEPGPRAAATTPWGGQR
jgi:Tfp pilus assembly protein PilN